jgi:hypothetical protein
MQSATVKTLTTAVLLSVATLPASASGVDDDICFTKLGSTFRLIELYGEGETVDPFLLDQLDKTDRYCSEVTDPLFAECRSGIEELHDLAENEGQGAGFRAQALESEPVCSAYLEAHRAPKQPI